jgi:hypothetical protein
MIIFGNDWSAMIPHPNYEQQQNIIRCSFDVLVMRQNIYLKIKILPFEV